MNNSPGWASPGSAPSDEPDRGDRDQPDTTPAPDDRTGEEAAPPPQWSKQQPPAGTWSPPAGVPGPRGRATAGHGGGGPVPGGQVPGGPPWGGGWAPLPPAAKPGVIPLRPLGVGEILDGALSTLRAHWRPVVGISLVIAVVAQTAITLVTGLWFPENGRTPVLSGESTEEVIRAFRDLGKTLLGSGITSLIGLLATIFATGLLTMIVSRAVLGRPVTAGEAWRDARPQLPRLCGLLFLLTLLLTAVILVCTLPGGIIVAVGSAPAGFALGSLGLLAGGALAVWLWVRFSLAPPALMLEKQGVLAAMRRSAKLVRGSWWRILGIQLLMYVIVGVVAFLVQIPVTLIAFILDGDTLLNWVSGTAEATGWTFLTLLGLGAVISSALTFPLSAGVTALLYMDQRIRRESLDIELAHAAGLTDYDTPSPTPHVPGQTTEGN
ncbi:glycerophosphoryl diester phosphodiesterase membrane domain-containing protein [Streptomyces catenulae]|uniref:Glycerophosphoryl diester phosphodiesterase membrane domain-containing protein n=1 Tax=Streptomyces catenulae TaxID=66875 RepID=A0ABV2Z995_9ACTN|nr:glycerophosphoryl diester phosphodiesterase membrane domain-containing protein [Streptomyces catenulae]